MIIVLVLLPATLMKAHKGLAMFYCIQLLAQVVSCDWEEVTFQMKAEWRSASTTLGVLCVMTPGEVVMLQLCVDSWDM